MNYVSRILTFLIFGVAWLATTAAATAQGRGEARITDPGGLRTVGTSSATNNFQSYSYGLGGSGSGYSPSAPTGALGSNISSPVGFNVPKSSLGGTSDTGAPSLGMPRSGAKVYGKIGEMSTEAGNEFFSRMRVGKDFSYQYANMFALPGGMVLDAKNIAATAITSLVPSEPSAFSNYIRDGDAAFRRNDFAAAKSQFQSACYIGPATGESLVSMALTEFSLAHTRRPPITSAGRSGRRRS